MNSKITTSFMLFFAILFTSCLSEAQNSKSEKVSSTISSSTGNIEIIQFHSENRCMTCKKIEEVTRETLKDYPEIPFSLVNVDDKKNEKQAEEFEASGTALFLYNPKTGKKTNLTDFAFMNAGNKEKFIAGLKKEIDKFLKS